MDNKVMCVKIKFIIFSTIILMYQSTIVYSSSEENDSSYSFNDNSNISDEVIANFYNEKDVEKRNHYLKELNELKKAVEENNFPNNDKLQLIYIIEWAEELCIQWDKINSDINHIDAAIETINEIVLQRIQKKTKFHNKTQYKIATNIMDICNKLKQDLNKLLVK